MNHCCSKFQLAMSKVAWIIYDFDINVLPFYPTNLIFKSNLKKLNKAL